MYNVPQFTIGQFYVNTPGNLSDPIRMSQLYNLVNDLEHLPGSWGPVGSNFFMREFGSFEKHVEDPMSTSNISESSITYRDEDLKLFLEWPEYDHWNLFIRLDEKSGTLSKFMFTTAYHGDNLQDIAERGILLDRWRKTLEKYRDDLNISAFHDDAHFIDLIENMPTDTWQSVLGTLVCMAVICFIFLYDTFTVVVVSLAILSIMTGIIGNASWMGLALEPIMMSAMLISMGFSIDIPAHVSYHYNSADAHHEGPITVEERLRFCLAAVGLPALQAASSTMLCLTGLLLVPLYMAQVFVKMMASCITLCLIHGLLIMPCIFSLIDTLMRKCQRLTSKVCSVEEVRR
ncbi:hypothetical protein AB6A40_010838 [Gnathostoma spinigerum]|uniref:Patched family protein n=1 Tax=Gnathostoma spinigerum TaxID=75299 RepID=A0ABD6F0M0_9BILA